MTTRKTARRGRGEGSVFYREDRKLWCAVISLGTNGAGKRVQRRVYGQTKQEAMDKLDALREQRKRGRLTVDSPHKLTVGEYLDAWLPRRQVKPATREVYLYAIEKHIKPALGNVRLSRLTAEHIAYMLAGIKGSTQTRKLVYAVLSKALRDAKLKHVCEDVVEKPSGERREMQCLSPQQAQAFLAEAAKGSLHELYVVALTTGMRQGELFALRWDDVDFEGRRLTVKRTLRQRGGTVEERLGSPKTKASYRVVHLAPEAVNALRTRQAVNLREGNAASPYVFCNRTGEPLRRCNVVTDSFKPILKKAGLPTSLRFHDLRHSCATFLLSRGVSTNVVSEMIGHARASTTADVYGHVLPGAHEAAASMMGGLVRAGGA